MTPTCPKCGRFDYTGKTRTLQPDECGLADGASCRAYRHGVEVGTAEADRLGRAVLDVVRHYPEHVIKAWSDNSRARGDEIIPRLLDAIAAVLREEAGR